MPATLDPITGDPLLAAHFGVFIKTMPIGYFTECTGLGSETEVVEHKIVELNLEPVNYKIPGRTKWGDITLKRGITANMDVWLWRHFVETGDLDIARQHGSIIVFSQEFLPIAHWDFYFGWPSKISSPAVKADSNEIMIEELTITHEGIARVLI